MFTHLRRYQSVIFILLIIFFTACSANRHSEKTSAGYKTVRPNAYNGLLFGNPGKGWVKMWWDPEKPGMNKLNFDGGPLHGGEGAILPYISTGYHRLNWSKLEPADEQYNWAYIDDMITACTALGFQFAFGIMPENSFDSTAVTPDWVFDIKGARFTTCKVEGTGNTGSKGSQATKRVAVWNDKIYMEQYREMTKALAARYDGDPRIAFIDIRSYGNYGEWHIAGLNGSVELNDEEQKPMIDMFSDFKKTTLIVVSKDWTATPGNQVKYAVDKYNTGIRNDGMLSSDLAVRQCLYGWQQPGRGPGVGELTGSYTHLKNSGAWSDSVFIGDIRDGRLSYVCLGYWGEDTKAFFQDKKQIADEWLNKMGYWLQLKQVKYSAGLGNDGKKAIIEFDVQNNGVAYPALRFSCVKLALIQGDKVVEITPPLKNVHPFEWKPDGEISSAKAIYQFSGSNSGTRLAIGFFSNADLQQPDILLANEHQLKGTKWYVISDMPQVSNTSKK